MNPPDRPPRPSRSTLSAITAVPAVTWLSAFGAALMLVAAIALTPDWKSLDVDKRLWIIAMTNAIVIALAEWSRRRLPIVGRALSHLAPVLLAPSAILAAASTHEHWPAAIAIGGLVGLIATEFQHRRLHLVLLPYAAVAAAILGGAGVAALSHSPLGPIVALLAVVAVLAGRARQSTLLAIGSGLVPLVGYLGDLGIGPGTLRDLGARGEVLSWSAPLAGLIAAVLLFRRAGQVRKLPLVVVGAAILISDMAAGFSLVTFPRTAILLLPGLVLLTAEGLVAWKREDSFWQPLTAAVSNVVLIAAGVMFVAVGWSAVLDTVSRPDTPLAAGLAVLFCGVVLSYLRLRDNAEVRTLVAAGGGLLIGAVALAGTGQPWLASAVLLAASFLTALRPPTSPVLSTLFAGLAWMVGALQPSSHEVLSWAGLTVIVQLVAITLVLGSLRHTLDRGPSLVVAMWPPLLTVGMTWYLLRTGSFAIITGIVAAVICTAQFRRSGQTAWVAMVAPTAAYLAIERGSANAAFVMIVVLVALAVSAALLPGVRAYRRAVAALAPYAVVTVASSFKVDVTVIAIALLVLGTLAAAMALVRPIREIDVLALAFLLTGLACTVVAHDGVLASIAGLLIGLFVSLWAAGQLNNGALIGGLATAYVSLASLPYTAHGDTWLERTFGHYGWRNTDLAMALVVGAALLGGALLTRYRPQIRSWASFGPALGCGAVYALTTLDVALPARAGVTIGLAIVAIAVGGLRRMAAPLMVGSVTTIATLLVMVGPKLASLSLWLWVAVGGAFLIGLAMMIERKVTDAEGDQHRVVELIWRGYR